MNDALKHDHGRSRRIAERKRLVKPPTVLPGGCLLYRLPTTHQPNLWGDETPKLPRRRRR